MVSQPSKLKKQIESQNNMTVKYVGFFVLQIGFRDVTYTENDNNLFSEGVCFLFYR